MTEAAPAPHAESCLPAALRELLPLLTAKFYENLTTHVGADAKGNVIGPPIVRDPDAHMGVVRYAPHEPLYLRVDPTERVMDFLRAAAEAFVPAPGEAPAASHADALLRASSPRVPGALRVCFVSAAGVHVLDLHRPGPLDDDAGLRAVDVAGRA